MPPFISTMRLFGRACGVGVCALLAVEVYERKDRKVGLLASWTTNFKPSVPWDSNWDRREPAEMVKPSKNSSHQDKDEYNEQLKKTTPTATRHLFLIRHGQYNMQPETDAGRGLTKLGELQAEMTGLRLKEFNKNYTELTYSTMRRATETGKIIASCLPDIPTKQCDLLREGAPIPPEPPVGHWRPGVQQFYEDGARIEAAFRKYFHRADVEQKEDSYEVIVCHANVIRYFVCRALQFPPEAWLRLSLYNGSITQVSIRPSGRVILRTLGDAGHMPSDKLTTT